MDDNKGHNPDVKDPGYEKVVTVTVNISGEEIIQIYRTALGSTHDTEQEVAP